jgi:phosphate transport system substrate-binding protein
MVKYYLIVIRIILALLFLLPAACGQSAAENAEEGQLHGAITVSGAWALYPLMVQWATEFQAQFPEVKIDVSAGGAGKGMADVLADAVDIGMVSRQVYPEEMEKGAFWVSVAKDAVFATCNEANPVRDDLSRTGLKRETLVGIFITGSVVTWGEAVGRPEINDPIHVFTRSDAAGAPATWAEYLGKSQEDLLGIGVYGDPGLLDAVIKDPLAIGYNNLNYAYDQETGRPVAGACIVPIDVNENGQVDPEERYDTKEQAVDAVATSVYPSPPARDLNLVTHGPPLGLSRVFIEWILTDGQRFVGQAGYVALPEDRISREADKLK